MLVQVQSTACFTKFQKLSTKVVFVMKERETLASRIGFLFLSAGCAIGLGNVWRFPYITGKYGGAAFVLLYLIFLLLFGLPVMVMEFSVGRASKRSIGTAFNFLEPQGTKWHIVKYFQIAGNYLIMMFYTTVSGWMLYYFYSSFTGKIFTSDQEVITNYFLSLVSNPSELMFWMIVTTSIGFGICALGLQNGVERITKYMMSGLLVIMIFLAIYVGFLKGASEGYKFYIKPDFKALAYDANGNNRLWEAVYAAMGQAFFTLSIGMGGMEIFGSYIDKKYSLTGEAIRVIALDTAVALTAGLIIFPACYANGVKPNSGAGLVLITLPSIFTKMPFGRLISTLFFLFMSFASLTTVIGVFENIVAFRMDINGWSRKKSVIVNYILIILLSLPCVFGMNIWSGVHFGPIASIDAFEDFLVSNNVLPLGSMVFLFFCTWNDKHSWGWDNFIKEADTGDGIKFPNKKWVHFYIKYIVPIIFFTIFIMGYVDIFFRR